MMQFIVSVIYLLACTACALVGASKPLTSGSVSPRLDQEPLLLLGSLKFYISMQTKEHSFLTIRATAAFVHIPSGKHGPNAQPNVPYQLQQGGDVH
ncbi:hypothetical protein DTO280E4_9133 [Paecilomyces variotii]|nr:hypothetical protein DTO021C3_8963 [Paecilomyces variotii]KAJ9349132.1 hypothetical protein DTO280E4_9133 [Paecilomyces variotii]